MICGHERVHVGISLGMIALSLLASGCESSSEPNEAMARRQWEMSVQQNRRELEKHGAAASSRNELAAKDREIAKLQAEVKELRERIVQMESESSHDGRVLRVDLEEGVVWIDRGESDGVTVKQVYHVVPATGVIDPRQPRSDIEVLRLLGPHLAEARLLDVKSRNVMVGDRLHSQAVRTDTDIPKVNLDEGEVLSYETELEMVEISLGTRAGLVKGERLHVYRESPARVYLGQIQVLNAAPNKAFAQIVGGSKQAELAAGDRVCKKLPEGLTPTPKARVD